MVERSAVTIRCTYPIFAAYIFQLWSSTVVFVVNEYYESLAVDTRYDPIGRKHLQMMPVQRKYRYDRYLLPTRHSRVNPTYEYK